MNQDSWNERYRSRTVVWSGDPNAHLVSEASGLVPGAALDVGSGEGADAVWLAERGWRVTAVDFSTIALERGAARAVEVGDDVARRIDWLHRDVTEWAPAEASYDLVSAQFMHLPKEPREALFLRLAASVAPGGSLLIVGHHPSDLQTTVPRPPLPELFYSAGEVADSLDPDRWRIIVSAARRRSTVDPAGRTVTVHDAVLHARRLS
ncbi:MAG: class I SAM-dependent methyltransferase [Candidatus Velthaea sp.]